MVILKLGSVGTEVRTAQQLLSIPDDGYFGEETAKAVVAFQQTKGLLSDSIIGPNTWKALTGKRDPKVLSAADLEKAAVQLDVPIAAIKAVAEVESAGAGFLSNGRPVILFERHIFYRQLNERGLPADELAGKYANLVSRSRGGYAGGTAEWSRLNGAKQIDVAAAIESASWGRFQIMGFHWKALGYEGTEAFEAAMHENEGAHLQAFVRFIAADPALAKALKSQKWADFARRYNGPAYQDNLYDVKLARAYEKHKGTE